MLLVEASCSSMYSPITQKDMQCSASTTSAGMQPTCAEGEPNLQPASSQVLADFWWAHVVPAKHAIAAAATTSTVESASAFEVALADGAKPRRGFIADPQLAAVAAAAAAGHRPPAAHPKTAALVAASKAMAAAATATIFPQTSWANQRF